MWRHQKVSKVLQVNQDILDPLAPPDPQGRVAMEHQVHKAHQDHLGQLVTLQLESQGPRGRGDTVFLEHQVKGAPWVQWALLGSLACLEWGNLGQLDSLGCLGSQVLQVATGLLDPLECLGRRVIPGLQGSERSGNQVLTALQAYLAPVGQKAPRDKLEYPELPAYQVLENQAYLDCKGIEELQAPQAQLVRKENQGQWDTLGIPVLLGLWAQLALRVREGFRECQEYPDLKVDQGQQGIRAFQGVKEIKGKGEKLGLLDQEDQLGLLVLQVHQV
ncbi:hypothetical protein MATL_G00201260 [Megalops atlanticus]|uniref:Uncharacterized protein n=1 Tax=Megalops atlanticus TaxID=7932 RepID=A0A9D3PHJ2_MEGAT|nr:hypothetical protein MATL_G00201260 [Megalops atlanticus]